MGFLGLFLSLFVGCVSLGERLRGKVAGCVQSLCCLDQRLAELFCMVCSSLCLVEVVRNSTRVYLLVCSFSLVVCLLCSLGRRERVVRLRLCLIGLIAFLYGGLDRLTSSNRILICLVASSLSLAGLVCSSNRSLIRLVTPCLGLPSFPSSVNRYPVCLDHLTAKRLCIACLNGGLIRIAHRLLKFGHTHASLLSRLKARSYLIRLSRLVSIIGILRSLLSSDCGIISALRSLHSRLRLDKLTFCLFQTIRRLISLPLRRRVNGLCFTHMGLCCLHSSPCLNNLCTSIFYRYTRTLKLFLLYLLRRANNDLRSISIRGWGSKSRRCPCDDNAAERGSKRSSHCQ
ncbi:Uncharacterised protein [Arcanobacterium haemolyticum]|nr:Uncharacterised protein [Arcanobacterium haemolyticum]